MARNLTTVARVYIPKVFNPLARLLLRAGVSPNAVTVAGTLGVLVGCLGFVTRGELLVGTLVVTVSVLTDMLDGAMARVRGTTSKFGAFLDSTMDRIADGAIFGSLAYWLATTGQDVLAAVALICLVAGQIVSYAKARAEGLGVSCNVGVAERGERLLVIGIGALLNALGVPYVLETALWVLAALAVLTAGQRIAHVYRQTHIPAESAS